MRTIGLAVAVPEPWGGWLQDYRTALGDLSAPGIPTHITVLPPTEVDPTQVPLLEEHLARAAASQPAFEVVLAGTDTFRPVSPVVFVALEHGVSGCERLAAAVRTGPLAVRLNFPYHPHVTVAHDLDDGDLDRAGEELAEFGCSFRVDRFSMYVHEPEAGWVPTRDFLLDPGVGAAPGGPGQQEDLHR